MPDTKKTRGAKASATSDKASPAVAAGRPNKLAPAKAARDVKVAVDGKLKKRWDETLGVIHKAKGQGAEAFDELWEAVAEVVEHEPPLYVIGRFASPKEFFEKVLQEKERTARRFIRVAKFATPHEEAKYGTTVLDAALAFIEATAEIKGVRVTVRGETATFSGVPVKSLATFGRSLAGEVAGALRGVKKGPAVRRRPGLRRRSPGNEGRARLSRRGHSWPGRWPGMAGVSEV